MWTFLRAVDEGEIPMLNEVDLIAERIAPQFRLYRLRVCLPSCTGPVQHPTEALAFSADCRRSGFVRIRWRVSVKVHRDGCRTVFVPPKHRAESGYRGLLAAPFVEQEVDNHLSCWEPVAFTGSAGRRVGQEAFFAPCRNGKGLMPIASTPCARRSRAQRSLSPQLDVLDEPRRGWPGCWMRSFEGTSPRLGALN